MLAAQVSHLRGAQSRGARRVDIRGRVEHMRPGEEALADPEPSQQVKTLVTEDLLDMTDSDYPDPGIKDVEFVASYNWLDRRSPTILVPGLPAKWLPPGPKARIAKDSDDYYRDPNAARYASYPIEPAVASIFQINPDFDAAKVDVFACGSTLGSLLSFTNGESRTFRFGVDLIGDSLFLVRRTNTPKQLIDDVYGYGHNFANAYTAWDHAVRGSASHQRVVSYDLCGLKCMVRSECDGYLPDKVAPKTTGHENLHKPNDGGGNIETVLSDLRFNSLEADEENASLSVLPIAATSTEIPQSSIFDLKTRSMRLIDSIKPDEFIQRLWVNQTPNLILAFHEYGTFAEKNIKVHNMQGKIRKWEQLHQVQIVRLRELLEMIREHARAERNSRLEVRRTGQEPLEIWSSPEGWCALPDKWRLRWLTNPGNLKVDNGPEDKNSNE